MKSLLSFGMLFFALSFCGITNKISKQIKEKTGSPDVAEKTSGDNSAPDKPSSDTGDVEKAELSPSQMSILDNGKEAKWNDQRDSSPIGHYLFPHQMCTKVVFHPY